MDCGWVFLGMEPHKGSMGQTPHARKNTLQIHVLFLILALWNLLRQGLVTVPFWVYWTSPKKVAMALTIYLMDPNGWVMFNGDISHDP